MTDPHRDANALTIAALIDMTGRARAIQAAILRGAPDAEVEAMRQEALAVAESYLDHTIEGARAVRAIIAGHPDQDILGEAGAKRLLD